MKKNILITGANSYVGSNVEKWLSKEPDKYYVETLDMKDPNWKEFDFSEFDVVFHVAGIAHVSNKKSMKDLYYKVNRDLTIETARKAKKSGVKQFIFMSSMIVYSSKEKMITIDTKPNPDNFYGQSKLDAELGIIELEDNKFNISVMRPPMIYGPNSNGNFPKLLKFANKTFIFPNIKNKRSMLYIDNLSIFVKNTINQNKYGIFFPQNHEYSSTTDIIKTVSTIRNKKIWFTKLFNPFIKLLRIKIGILNKVFGDYYYDIKRDILSDFLSLNDSILEIERIQSDE